MLAAAAALVLTGCLSVDDAYRAIDWRVLLLVAGMLRLGTATVDTGLAAGAGEPAPERSAAARGGFSSMVGGIRQARPPRGLEMKISCSCGNDISDGGDFMASKATLIADQDGQDLRRALEQGADPWSALRLHTAATAYQCTDCGRLVILRGSELYWFSPEETVPPLLYTARGAQWPRSLVGDWRDGRGELSWDSSLAPDDEDGEFRTDFASWQELYALYHSTFRRLLASGRLRSALLKRDGELVHLWPPKDAAASGTR